MDPKRPGSLDKKSDDSAFRLNPWWGAITLALFGVISFWVTQTAHAPGQLSAAVSVSPPRNPASQPEVRSERLIGPDPFEVRIGPRNKTSD